MTASEGPVNLADKLHVVEEGVEGIEVGEAHHVGCAASSSLHKDPESSFHQKSFQFKFFLDLLNGCMKV